jgi:hypothetical protein
MRCARLIQCGELFRGEITGLYAKHILKTARSAPSAPHHSTESDQAEDLSIERSGA